MSLEDYYLIASVEVGITNSGYVYSFRNDFRDTLRVCSCVWHTHNDTLSTNITALLLDDKKNSLLLDSMQRKNMKSLWRMEKKRNLQKTPQYINRLTMKSTLQDATGKYILIKDVFTHGITYMTRHFMSFINKQTNIVPIEDVKWIFIAPFGREDDRKFMRDAAVQAGIGPDDCAVDTRQEALMFYFMYHLRRERVDRKEEKYTPENMYVLVDAREYDVEITVMEIQANGKMKQMTNIIDESCGRKEVLYLFEKMLCRVFGDSLIKECKEGNVYELKGMMDDFLSALTRFLNDDAKLTVMNPMTFRDNYSSTEDINVNAVGWTFIGNKLRIPFSTIKPLVNEVALNVTELIRKSLESEQTRGAHTILMSGQMSRILVFQEYLKHNFPEMRVIISKDFDHSHTIGGVVFGHTNGILSRSHFKLDVGIETYAEIDFVPKQL